MKQLFLSLCFFVFLINQSLAQTTGPGGVGTSTDIRVWIDASQLTGTSEGSNVGTFTDFSGNGRNLTGFNNPTFTFLGPGGMPAVNFNGTNEYYSIPAAVVSGLTEAEVFILTELDEDPPTGSNSGLWDFGSTTDDELFPATNGRIYEEFGTTVRLGAPNPADALDDGNIYNVVTTASDFLYRLNGTQLTSRASNTVQFTTSPRLGRTDGSTYFDGKISEMVIYDAELDSAKKIILDNYFAAKYNVPISTDRYAYNPDHRFELAGIGRVNASNIHNDAKGQGLVRMFAASLLSDNDFLLWAHDNASLNNYETLDIDGVTIQSRMSRVWRLDETDGGNLDGVGTVSISFDVSSIPGSISGSDLRLLIDRDGDGFADNDVAPASGTFAAGVVTFINVDVEDGDFFTLGSIDVIATPLGNQQNLYFNHLGPGGVGDSMTMNLWISADQLNLNDGDNVPSWNDISLRSNDLTGFNDPRFVSNGIGGVPSVDFNGTNEYYTLPTAVFNGMAEAEVFVINELDADPPASNSGLWDFGETTDNEQFPATNGRIFEEFATNVRLGNPNPGDPLDDPNVYNVVSESGSYEYFLNGSSLNSRASNTVSFSTSPRLGRSNGGSYFSGKISELVLYNYSLNSAQQNIVENYFSSKYSIIISGDLYSFDPEYRFELAGIGRESANSLHKDAQGSGLVRVNTPSALSDGDYLLWAHNGGDLELYNEDDVDGVTIESRMVRVWRFNETDGGDADGVGTVNISFDLANVPGGINGADLRLLIDRDDDGFEDNDVAPQAGSLNGTIVSFSAVDFEDGDQFTIGTTDSATTPLGLAATTFFNNAGPGGVGDSSTMNLWVKADVLGLADGSNVATWTDFSGNSNDLVGSNDPRYNTTGIGGSAAIEFNGSNEFYSVPLNVVSNLSHAEVFIVNELDADPPASNSGLWDFGSTNDDELFPATNGRIFEEFGTTTRLGNPNPADPLDDGNLYNVVTETGSYEYFLNGTSLNSRASNTVSFTNSPRLARTDGGTYFDGLIGEMVIYNYSLNDAQRNIVNNYFSSKYSIAISNDLYSHDPIYRFEVAGIGQASATDIHRDAKGSGLVRVYEPDALSNGDYLLWGHDSSSLATFDTLNVDGVTIESRMTRVWVVEETDGGNADGVGTVSLSVDMSAVSGPIAGADLRLLIDRDGDGFSDNDVAPQAGTYLGTTIIFSNVDFEDGDRFTVGSIDFDQTPLGLSLSTTLNNQGPGGVGDSSTMALWVRADAFSLADGANAPTWFDQSGNGRDLTGFNDPRYLESGIGGSPAIDFNGSNEYYSVPTVVVSSLSQAEVFVITRLDADPPASNSGLWDFGSTNDDELFPQTNGRIFEEFGTTVRLGNPNPATSLAQGNIYNVKTFPGTYQYILNETSLNTRASNTVGFTTSPRLARTDGGTYYDGRIGDLVIYNYELNNAQRIIVNNHFSSKYTVAINNDRFAHEPQFRYEVAGIGRTSASSQHKDAKGSGLVRMRDPSALSNNDFLLWGHNNGSLDVLNELDVDGTTIESRMSRVWRIDETDGGNADGVGTVTLIMDLTDVPGNKDENDLRLLIDRDGDGFFDNDVAPISGSYNGTTIQFEILDLEDGDFFTIGSVDQTNTPLGNDATVLFNHLGPGGVGDSSIMTLWVKANELGLADGADVNSWTDFSGNENDLTGINTPRYSTFGIGGGAAIDFNGSNEYFTVPLDVVSSLSEAEVFIALELDADPPSSNSGLWDFGSTTEDELLPQTNGRIFEEFGTNQREGNPNPAASLADPSIYNVVTQTGFFQFGLNETTLDTRNSNIVEFTSSPRIARTDGSTYFDGKIGEVVIYNSVLNTTQQAIVYNYLAAKYGVTIASDLYAHEPEFRNEVAGIGRESASNFHKDAQGSGLVRVNFPTALSDGDYFFWGHNNNPLDNYNTIDIDQTLIESRMSRVWRIDETDGGDADGVGGVNISFDLSGVAGSITGSDLRLLIDRDGDGFFDNDVAPQSGTYSAPLLSFSNIDFEDGDYFTIGSIDRDQTPLGNTITVSLNNSGPGGVGDDNTMSLWVKANEFLGLSDGDNIVTWPDFSGNGNDLSGVNTPRYVASGANGRASIDFNGTNEFFTVPSAVVTDLVEADAFIIPNLDADPPASNSGLWDFGSTTDDELFPATNGRIFEEFGTTERNGNPNPGPSLANGNIYNVSSQSGSHVLRLNESTLDSRASNIVSFTSSPRLARTDGSTYFDGQISEFVIYRYILNDAQRIIVNNYFSTKYGISITNDKYAYDVGYSFELAGIGREDANNIHSDAQGRGVIRINNPDDLEDGEYFMFGNNGDALSTTGIADYPPEVEGRIRRVWRANETGGDGDVGNFDLYINLASLTGSMPDDIRLLIDTDDDGLFIDETTAGGGVVGSAVEVGLELYRFSSINIPNGRLFSIGTINPAGIGLPIELISFDAVLVDDVVQLDWITSSEVNNDYFSIERSANGREFNEILRREGAGTSYDQNEYQAFDYMPLEGVSYYRLRQTDFDGETDVFEPKVINRNRNSNSDELIVYPNPTSGKLFIELPDSYKGQTFVLQIHSPNGILLFKKEFSSSTSNETIIFNGLNDMPKGIYSISLSKGTDRIAKRVVLH